MTSLRTFQTEIDEISHREVAKQRAHALAERAKLEKDVKKTASKAHARKESTDAADVSKSPAKEAITTLAAPATGNGDAVMSDIDEQLQVSALPQPAPHRASRSRLCVSTITLTCTRAPE